MLVFKVGVGRNVVIDARAWKKDRTWGVFAALPHTYWLGVIDAVDGNKVTVTCVGCEGTFVLPRTALEVWWKACDEAGDDARVLAVKDEAERTAYDARSMLKGMPMRTVAAVAGDKKAGAVKIKESGTKKDAAAGVERGEGSGKKARVETTPPARKQPSRMPPSLEKIAGKRKQSSPSKCV